MITRREFVSAAAVAGASVFAPDLLAAEPPPETSRIRLVAGGLCFAPLFIAEEFLRAKGFDDIGYVGASYTGASAQIGLDRVAAGLTDISFDFATQHLLRIDAGQPLVIVGGAHAGCIEVFGARGIRALRDLKGKVVVAATSGGPKALLSLMFQYVGIDPNREIQWRIEPRHAEALRLLEAGEAQAYSTSPPRAQEVRARGTANVILNTTTDRPWSDHFCCLITAHREFVRKHPVAARRALRAILKAEALCSADPERAGRLIEKRYPAAKPEILVQAMKEIPYRTWRELSPEGTMRFYAIRMHELGIIKTDPKKLIARGADLRFFDELRKELKA